MSTGSSPTGEVRRSMPWVEVPRKPLWKGCPCCSSPEVATVMSRCPEESGSLWRAIPAPLFGGGAAATVVGARAVARAIWLGAAAVMVATAAGVAGGGGGAPRSSILSYRPLPTFARYKSYIILLITASYLYGVSYSMFEDLTSPL